MDKLKPCPFCGGIADVLMDYKQIETTGRQRFFVTCAVCGVETPRIARDKKQAIEAWNRRVDNGREQN